MRKVSVIVINSIFLYYSDIWLKMEGDLMMDILKVNVITIIQKYRINYNYRDLTLIYSPFTNLLPSLSGQ